MMRFLSRRYSQKNCRELLPDHRIATAAVLRPDATDTEGENVDRRLWCTCDPLRNLWITECGFVRHNRSCDYPVIHNAGSA